MQNSIFVKAILALSGLIATGVGSAILFIPHAFHASAGIVVADDVNLLNEMRASGGLLMACGLFALFGTIRAKLALPALVVSATLYLSYGLSRVVSVVIDGLPNGAMVQIMALELGVAVICLVALRSLRLSQKKNCREDPTDTRFPENQVIPH